MKELWLSAEEFARLMGWTPRHLNRMRPKLKYRETGRQTKNGKAVFEYSSVNLPAEEQVKLAGQILSAPAEKNLTLTASAPHVLAAPARENLTLTANAQRELARPCGFTPKQESEFAEVRELIRPMLERKDSDPRTLDELAAEIGLKNVGWLNKTGEPTPLGKSTVWRYYSNFRKGNLFALVRAVRKDRGRSQFFASRLAASAFVQQKYLNEGLSFQMCWEALRRDWQKVDGAGDPPSYGATRKFLRTIPKPARVLAHEGKHAYESKCSLSLRRAPVKPMEWWISDHRQFDVMVRNTLFAELKPDEPYRVWFTAILDWGSRKIVGWCFAPTPSSRTINSALRLAVLSHGFPRNFYWDNGEDYKKVRRDLEKLTLSDAASSILGGGGVQIGVTSALPFHPRSKPIEAHFTYWSKRFDVIWRGAYLGNKPGNRPESTRHSEALHQKFLKGKRAESPLPTDAEFILAAVQEIEDYNKRPHGSLNRRTPDVVMEESCPERNRPTVNPRLLDLFFWERTERVVQAGGCVQLDKMRYEPNDSSLALSTRQGQRVAIFRDPYNLGEAIAADIDTMQFIGELQIQELVAQAPNGRITRDQIKAAIRKQRSMARGYSEYLAVLSAVATNCGWRSEREERVQRATGTYGLTPASSVPGAIHEQKSLPPARSPRIVQPAFVSDAVERDKGIFDNIAIKDSESED